MADRAGGDFAGKPRPAIIVQSEVFDGGLSIIVCPLTSRDDGSQLIRLPVSPSSALRLSHPSWIMVDKLTSVRRDRLRQPLGRISDDEILALNRSLAVFLGFG